MKNRNALIVLWVVALTIGGLVYASRVRILYSQTGTSGSMKILKKRADWLPGPPKIWLGVCGNCEGKSCHDCFDDHRPGGRQIAEWNRMAGIPSNGNVTRCTCASASHDE